MRLFQFAVSKLLDGVRVACDLMALFFIYDEFTDKVDSGGARLYAKMVMDAIRNPHKERPRAQVEPKLAKLHDSMFVSWRIFQEFLTIAALVDFWLRADQDF